MAVAETLHFGKAAERLAMTQPPLSQSIRALEAYLGAPLFVRTKRTVAITPFGEQWLPHVRAVLSNLDSLADIARHIQEGDVGRLDLSFVSTADYGVLPMLVQQFRQMYPRIELALTEATSDLQISTLLEGKGHAGIIIPYSGAALPDSLRYGKLAIEPLIAAVPASWIGKDHFKLVDGRLTPTAVISSPLIVFPRRAAPSFYDLVTDYYALCGGKPQIAQHAIQMQTIISLVSASMGIALVPASMRNLVRAGVQYVDLQTEAPQLETGIVWRRDDTTPALCNLLRVIGCGATGLPSARTP